MEMQPAIASVAVLLLTSLSACRSAATTAEPSPVHAPSLWVATRGDNTVTRFDGEDLTALGSVEIGLGAHELAFSGDGRLGVGSAYGGPGPGHQPADTRLAVWNAKTGALLRTVDLGKHLRPNDIAFLSDNRRALVTSEVVGALLWVDLVAGTIERELDLRQKTGHMLAYAPDAPSPGGLGRVYVSHVLPGLVSAVDVGSGELLEQTPTAVGAEGIASTRDGATVWCLNNRSDSISVLDGQTLELVTTLDCPGFPFRAKISGDGRRVLVSCPGANHVVLFDVKSQEELRRIDFSALSPQASPQGVAISEDGRVGYVACPGLDAVVRLDLEAGTITHRRETGPMLDPIALTYR